MSINVTAKQKLSAYFGIMRPLNSFTAFVAVVLAMLLAIEDEFLKIHTYFFIGCAAYFTTAQANTHNDIVDIEVDRINSPERALPSGILSLKEAKIWASILFFLACLSGILIDLTLGDHARSWPFSLFWAVLNSLLLDSYNQWFKKNGLFGNFIVGYVVGALFFYADIIVNGKFTSFISGVGLFAMFLNWGREVIKGIRDIDGDREGGVKTIGVLYGPKGAAIVGSFLLFLAILSTIPIMAPVLYGERIIISIVLTLFDLIIIYKCFKLIQKPEPEYATSLKKLLLKLMFIAIVSVGIDQVVSRISI